MRTLRKVLCILCLAVLVASSAAWAAPAERADTGPSIVSWALSLVDTITAFLAPVDKSGGATDPGDSPQSFDEGEDLPEDEIIGGIEPGG